MGGVRLVDERPAVQLEVEQLGRSVAVLRPGAQDAVGREDALRLLDGLGDVHGRLDDLKRRLLELCESRPREGGRGQLVSKVTAPLGVSSRLAHEQTRPVPAKPGARVWFG